MSRCPVCQSQFGGKAEVIPAHGGYRVDCSICGKFALMEEAHEDLLDPQSGPGSKLTSADRARLAHKIRTGSRVGTSWIKVYSNFVERFIEDGCPGPNPAQQVTNLVKFVGDNVDKSGHTIRNLPAELFAIIGAPSPDFAGSLVMELIDRGILVGVDTTSMSGPPTAINVGLTLDGWSAYQTEKRGEMSSNVGFIAMKFGDSVLDPFVRDVVKSAVLDGTGYRLVDMRDIAQAGVIDNIMREQIRDAAFVIVDLTHDNSGAYWEAGYAEGLGKPVIYICERSKFDEAKTHFDTNHCTTVIWTADQPDSFCRELVATLRRSLNLFPDGR